MTLYTKLTETAKNLEKKGFCRRAVTQWRKAAFIADSEKSRNLALPPLSVALAIRNGHFNFFTERYFYHSSILK